ncbi:amidohydrolase family protein [Pyxidicoccus fallax]|uniref:Amidohydrolase family protein n=1 Tax=Pyxidicoccus fallax TaxID=394095 RepID=A0A848LRX8_9BACT|nr:amidohydrolase family protein [Pyxidicoccus fallax]NMO20441.1 amidohydrolase family protein [Pyxidicoccus fallax]NPC82031.1 amidohydrolase family protein [Pyxidicoccus fallax]
MSHKPFRHLLGASVLALAGLACEDDPVLPDADYALTHVTVIDATGGPPRPDMTVLIRDERIVELRPSKDVELPEELKTVDLQGRYLIPGLADMHIHTQDMEQVFPLLHVVNGVTTVREMDGTPFALEWRRKIEQGQLLGPRMVLGSPIIDGTPSLWQNSPVPHIAVRDEAEARARVREAKSQGYDFIKVYSRLSREAYFGIADEAKQLGIPFAGHVPDRVTNAEALEAGQASFEHLYGVMYETSSEEAALRERVASITLRPGTITGYNTWFQQTHAVEWDAARTYSPGKGLRLFGQFARSPSANVPTLAMHDVLDRPMDLRMEDDRLKYLPVSTVEGWKWQLETIYLEGRSEEESTRRRELFQRRLALVGEMHRAGVRILAGTDSTTPWVFPGFSLHDELALLVQAGLTPLEAIQAATLEPARFLGREHELGTVEKGKAADLVVLDANPLDDIRNTTRIHSVVVRGRYISEEERRNMLLDLETLAKQL